MDLNQVTAGWTDLGRSERLYRALGLRLIVQDHHYLRFECPEGLCRAGVNRKNPPWRLP